MKNLNYFFALLVAVTFIVHSTGHAQTYWQTLGNTNTQLPVPPSTSFAGTVDSTDYVLKACNVECARFGCDGNVTFSGTVKADNIKGGVIIAEGHVNTDADTTAASPARCDLWADNQQHALIEAVGNLNTLPVIDVKTSYAGNTNVVGLNVYTIPNKGYGYGVNSQGGKRGLSGSIVSSNYTGSTYGVYGSNSGSSGTRFGVYGAVTSGTVKYGVYGSAPAGTNSYAGFFSGNLQYTGQLIGPSDRKLKRSIVNLASISDKLNALQPVSFYFKNDEYPSMNFPATLQFGLIADDVQKLFPELVTENFHPNFSTDGDDADKGGVSYKGVNYIGFIPLLIESFKEQKQFIDELKNQNNELIARLNKLEVVQGISNSTQITNASLGQNDPNPFNQITTIHFSLPGDIQNAQLKIYSSSGSEMRATTLSKGSTSITINANALSPGIYVYVLIVDGKTIDSRQMIITR
ncbi:MAG: tail fiber domain-containing protein [Bacteroidia bacterium]